MAVSNQRSVARVAVAYRPNATNHSLLGVDGFFADGS